MSVRWLAALSAVAVLFPGEAFAARRPWAEVFDDEVLPARAAELQGWVVDWLDQTKGVGETDTWWAPVLGLSPHAELALPVEFSADHSDGVMRFSSYAADFRWRFQKPAAPRLWHPSPLLRVELERPVAEPLVEGKVDLVVGTDVAPAVHTAVMLGAQATSNLEEAKLEAGLGVIGNATPSLRIGGEVFAKLGVVPSGSAPWVAVGPDVSYTLGSFWITLGGLAAFGDTRPYDGELRLLWGVEF